MRIRTILIALVATILTMGGLSALPTPAEAAFPGADGRIVFVDIQDGDDAIIFSMSELGEDVQQLTTTVQSPYGDLDPSWSPGGTMIVFTRYTSSGNGEIWRMDADGSDQKRLTTNAADDILPTFSADGARIAFSTDRNGNYDIYSMDVNGGDLKRLTTHEAHDLDAAWSPDNTRIAFSSDRRQAEDDRYFFEIYTMSSTGASVARETNGSTVEAHDFSPDWHPYERQLTFTRSYGSNDFDILFVDPATNAITARTGSADLESASVYAPSQGMIVGDLLWEQNTGGDWDIARATRTGVGAAYLTFEFAGDQLQPDWQPQPVFPLIDWRFSPFANDIEFIFDAGITGGCAAGKFCPTAPVTRGQMAAFLARAFSLPPTATDYFTDDETSTFEASINRVAAAGITGGCGDGKYCPLQNVTRGQMAAFLHRALD